MPVSLVSRRPVLYSGSDGNSVSRLQHLLTHAGFDCGGVDGDFGPQTRAAVLAFQKAHGLESDGLVGPKTWEALQAAPVTPTPKRAGDGIMELEWGSRGLSVQALQRGLKDQGYEINVDGNFNALTDAAVRRFQADKGLDVDGIVGPSTWRALRGPSGEDTFTPAPRVSGNDAALRGRILELAQGEIGRTEATNRNDGQALKYPRYFGRGREAWCDDFVSWVNTHAGNPMNDFNCETTHRTMVAEGRWKGRHDPQPGDIVLFDWNGDRHADHIGIVKAVNSDGSVQTIEGNTSKRGNHEGVWEKRRTLETILGFGNPV
jgi:peptidoglycan hydrolase-like protein with peptidoglycan-binding domain